MESDGTLNATLRNRNFHRLAIGQSLEGLSLVWNGAKAYMCRETQVEKEGVLRWETGLGSHVTAPPVWQCRREHGGDSGPMQATF